MFEFTAFRLERIFQLMRALEFITWMIIKLYQPVWLCGLHLGLPSGSPRFKSRSRTLSVDGVCPGLGILQPQWNPYPTIPRLLLRHGTILQCVSLSMARQYPPTLFSSTHTHMAVRESPIMTAMTNVSKLALPTYLCYLSPWRYGNTSHIYTWTPPNTTQHHLLEPK